MIKDKLIKYFSKNLKEILADVSPDIFEKTQEIRIRLNKGVTFRGNLFEYVCLNDGSFCEYKNSVKDIYLPTSEDFRQILEIMSNYSIYAFEDEIKNGFLTIQGGFRVGLVGKVVMDEDKIKTIKNISSLNIRISREVRGCSKKVLPYILNGNESIKNTMIVAPPNCGKTTLLRDLILNISNLGFNIGVVDERSEIAGSYMGQNQVDLGMRTDVLDCCPKDYGMLLLLRSMAPSVIAVDEIGSEKDVLAIESVVNSGVKLICSIHSEGLEEFKNKKSIKNILKNNIFERFIFLDRSFKVGTISAIYDENFQKVDFRQGVL